MSADRYYYENCEIWPPLLNLIGYDHVDEDGDYEVHDFHDVSMMLDL